MSRRPLLAPDGPRRHHTHADPLQRKPRKETDHDGKYLAGTLEGKDLLLDRSWKIDEYEVALVIQIVFTTLVDDADEIVLCRSAIGNQAVHLSANE
jgi:hypothetical protein